MNYLTFRTLTVGLIAASVALTGCAIAQNPRIQTGTDITQSGIVDQELIVFRSPTCGCCGQWIEHVKAAGFQVQDRVTEDMAAIKEQYGVPGNLESCHTTIAGEYVIEGHIPAEDVQRLLTEKPDVAGIAVPGMPIGSPGMESGSYIEPYTVFTFSQSGDTSVFSEHS